MEKLLKTAKFSLYIFFGLLVLVIVLKLHASDHCRVLNYSDYIKYIKTPGVAVIVSCYLMILCSVISFVSTLIAQILRYRNKEKKKSVSSGLLFFSTIAVIIISLAMLSMSTASQRRSFDARRVADLRQIQIALNLYHGEFGSYPVVAGNTAYDRWEELGAVLDSAGVVASIPYDYCVSRKGSKEHQYDYKSNGDYYLVKTLLTDAFIALEDDLDGEILGIWCGEEGREIEYCVGPLE